MSAVADLNMCVLFEHELRLAAKLMREAFDHAHATEAETDQRSEIYTQAIIATHHALAGLTDDRAVVLIDAKRFIKESKPA